LERVLRSVRHFPFCPQQLNWALQVRPELDNEKSAASSNSPESVHSAHTPPSIGYSRSTPVADFPYPTPQTLPDSAAFHASPTVGSQNSSEEEDLAHIGLSRQLSKLAIDTIEDRFFGKSRWVNSVIYSLSIIVFTSQRVYVDAACDGDQNWNNRGWRLFWKKSSSPFFLGSSFCESSISHRSWAILNKKQWEVEHVNSDLPQFEFPDKDLLDHLVTLYFERLNLYTPLLHRPTFERDLANDLHLHDTGFGQVVLMVCALASRCTNDPRVTLPNDKTGLSSGFKFFRQTRLLRNKLLDRASLYDVQYFCVSADFLLLLRRNKRPISW